MGLSPASRFFNRDFEKSPSPEEKVEVVDFTDLDLEYEGAFDESFADELVEIEERMAGVAMDLPQFKLGQNGETLELVSQNFIRALMKSPPLSKPPPDFSIEALRGLGMTDEEELETVVSSFRALESARDIQNDIIAQYRANGYAYAPLPKY
jgi:hypothetical protein